MHPIHWEESQPLDKYVLILLSILLSHLISMFLFYLNDNLHFNNNRGVEGTTKIAQVHMGKQ